ncbi:MAG TPA: TQO small subunit DoxD [Gammaproteobacteria bacterium]|nr:TQO small subunit DoxD [Gammaproteobacteria bacterium]
MSARIEVPAWLIVLARLYLAATFLLSDHGSAQPGEMQQLITSWSEKGRLWYRPFLADVVLPHLDLFTMLVLVGELYVGFALLLGLTTRLAVAVALFMLLNYWFAKPFTIGIPGIDTADIVLAVIVLVTAAGRVLGLDRYLHRRYPRVPLW